MEAQSASSQFAADVLSVWGATWWDAAQAVGTLTAVLVALALAGVESVRAARATRSQREMEARLSQDSRRAVASLVSSWVEARYEPSRDGNNYTQRGTLFVANESNEPVFDVHVSVGVGSPVVQLGPLAAPVPLPVLPPRRTRQWDISSGLLAYGPIQGQYPSHPTARIDFTDARGVRWHRDFEGTLSDDASKPTPLFNRASEVGDAQVGDLENPFHPMAVALTFMSCLYESEEEFPTEQLRFFLDENANGWKNLDSEMRQSLRDGLADYGVAAHVWYPAPRVAYVRLVHDDDADIETSVAGYVQIRGQYLTLRYVPEIGWRVFSVGITSPDWIEFPEGNLSTDLRDS